HAPPTAAALGALAPVELRRLGLHARRAATLVRVCTSLDLERLRGLPATTVAQRLGRERGLGPWSVGVVALEGLGRTDLGKIGESLLAGLLSSGSADIVVTARRPERVTELHERHGVEAVLSNADAASGAGLVVLAVKPQDFEELLGDIRGAVTKEQTVLSVA